MSRPARVIAVTGTSTDVGKTVATAALAAALRNLGHRVGIVKAAQTGIAPGEEGDLAVVDRLLGVRLPQREGARHPEPLAPLVAARRAGQRPLDLADGRARVTELAAECDVVLVEGAGGVLVELGAGPATEARPWTLVDLVDAVATATGAPVPVVVVADPALGTLNHVALTRLALGPRFGGLVWGAWPASPGVAETTNAEALAGVTLGRLPAGIGGLSAEEFVAGVDGWLDPARCSALLDTATAPAR